MQQGRTQWGRVGKGVAHMVAVVLCYLLVWTQTVVSSLVVESADQQSLQEAQLPCSLALCSHMMKYLGSGVPETIAGVLVC